jgi:hypothetical protein
MRTLALIIAAIVAAAVSSAQETASHTVTVLVLEQNDIRVVGGDITISVIPPPTGSVTVTNDSCDLYWATNSNRMKKITVQTDLATPRYHLTVDPGNITEIVGNPKNGKPGQRASAQPVVLAGLAPIDFIDKIQRIYATCDLVYAATVSAGDGLGSETHTITYTLTDR